MTRMSRKVERIGEVMKVTFTSYSKPQAGLILAPIVRDGQRTGQWRVERWETNSRGGWFRTETLKGSKPAAARAFGQLMRAITQGLAA